MLIEEAVVIAGGAAPGRAWHRGSPPELMPIGNRPVLFHALDRLERAGVRRITLVAERADARAYRAAVARRGGRGAAIAVRERAGGRGLACAVRDAGASGPLLVQPAALIVDELRDALDGFARDRPDAVHLHVSPARAPAAECGWLLGPEAVEVLLAAGGREGAARALERRLDVRDERVPGFVARADDADSLLAANRCVLERLPAWPTSAPPPGTRVEGPVRVHRTALVERAVLRGPLVIGPGARVMDAYVGPYTSVGTGAVVEGAEIEYSIVMEEACVRFVATRIETSVIGRGARVERSFEVPSAMRLTVADGGRIALS